MSRALLRLITRRCAECSRGARSRTRNSRGTHGGWTAKGRSARLLARAAGGGTGWRLLWWRLLRLSECWLEGAWLARIEQAIQFIAEHIDRHQQRRDSQDRKNDHPPSVAHELLPVVQQVAPRDLRLVAQTEEFQSGFNHDHVASSDNAADDDQWSEVR